MNTAKAETVERCKHGNKPPSPCQWCEQEHPSPTPTLGESVDKYGEEYCANAVNAHEALLQIAKEEHDGKINEQYGEMSFKHKERPCDVCQALALAEGK